ncbi:hypothetical protein D3C83_286280 [compost metagenome]
MPKRAGRLFAVWLLAGGVAAAQTINLDDARTVEQLRPSNPAHYDKITQVVPSQVLQGSP